LNADLDELYRKYAADVFRFALYLSGERSDAEDITSETFVRAWTSSAPITLTTVRGYLFTIARNLFLQGRRKSARNVALGDTLQSTRVSPHEELEQRDELAAVMAQLRTLPEIDRAAMLMRAEYDLPYEEIARALGISVSAAKVKVHRARLALAGLRTGASS
jgi:RNA polymerase sigma-70 factor (ECF subfamily)